MLSTKAIEDEIIIKLKDLPEEGKKEVLEYIGQLKSRKVDKTIKVLRKTSGAWKDIIDAEELKRNISADRLISTRSRIKL